ncbi:MAG: hypothetical protein AAF790_09800 [Planctomycetota bacterium]
MTTLAASQAGLVSDWNGQDIIYRALLSDSTVDAIDYTNIQGRVYNTNGDLLALDAADFFDGELERPLDFDQNGNRIVSSNTDFFSGVAAGGGSAGDTCGNWDDPNGGMASVGTFVDSSWLVGNPSPCNTIKRLVGVSPAITVPIPEPSSLSITAFLTALLAGPGRFVPRTRR